jgi:hypothetical protein
MTGTLLRQPSPVNDYRLESTAKQLRAVDMAAIVCILTAPVIRLESWREAVGQVTPFGQLIKAGLEMTGLSQGRLGGLISDFRDGPVFDATGVRLIMEGKRRLTPKLVQQLIDILDLDPGAAWFHSGLRAPWVSLDDYRTLRERRSDRQVAPSRPGKETSVTSNVIAGPWPDDLRVGQEAA